MSQIRKKSEIQISHIVQLESDFVLGERQKNKLQNLLTEEAEYLLERKQRQLLKKQKLKELEEKYEQERQLKLQKIANKINKSEELRDKNSKDFQSKVKKRTEHYKSILAKISNGNQQSIEKQLQQRRGYESQDKSLAQSRSSKARNENNRSTFLVRNYDKNLVDVEDQMKRITERIHRASTNHYIHQQDIIERAKNQAQQVAQAKKKAHLHSSMLQDEILKNYYGKIESNYNSLNKSKGLTEKHFQDRKKSLEDKMKKCRDNIKHIEQQKQERLDGKLREKWDRKIIPKSWKNEKAQAYKQKFLQNNRKLQRQKYEKGEQIIRKHWQMSVKNKTLKQKKDKIYQAIMLS